MLKSKEKKGSIERSILGFLYTIVLIVLLSAIVSAQELSIGSNTVFSLGSSTLTLPGNWANSGTFNSDSSTVIFNGSNVNQTISGNFSFNDIEINKPSGDVQLLNNINVKGTLKITNGDLDGNNKIIQLGSTANLVETPGNTFKGGIITTTRDLNSPDNINIFGIVISSSSNLGATTISRGHTAQSGQGNYGILRYYDIQPAVNNNLNATIIFNYDESELNGLPEEDLSLFRSSDGGINWVELGGNINTQANTVTLNDLNSFSRFTIGSSSTPLPVELADLALSSSGTSVKLTWQTATETQNYGFEVERLKLSESDETTGWEVIGFVKGSGNSVSSKSYEFIDKKPAGGTHFKYRLKQIDNDGTFKYSGEVEIDLAPAEFHLAQNYPNPFNPSTTIKFSLPSENYIRLTVYNIVGEQVAVLINELKPAGIYDIAFDASMLASGTYIYRLQAGSFAETKKMILTK